MCGLHGIITDKHETNADDFIRSAFVANMLRGTDSSGIASINVNKLTYDYNKLPVPGMYFVQDNATDGLIRDASKAKHITMCHVRAATVGKVNMKNAHPFVVMGDDGRVVIGTHNGTLQGWSTTDSGRNYSVDSEWAINLIAEKGYEAFESIKGAYCFVWWDSDNSKVLNIARNSERPMYVAMLKSGGMAYASEAGMLHWLLERHKVPVDGNILKLSEGFWYKFDTNNPKEFDKIKLPEQNKSSQYNNYTNYNNQQHSRYPTTTSTWSTIAEIKSIIEAYKKDDGKKGDKKEEETTNVVDGRFRHGNVTLEEHNNARNLSLLGEIVEFSPISEWADSIDGIAFCQNAELAASVRGYDVQFGSNDVWTCKIIGVQDDHEDMTLILDVPIKKAQTVIH